MTQRRAEPVPTPEYGYISGWYRGREAAGLHPGEIVAVPSELPDSENWEAIYTPTGNWIPCARLQAAPGRFICRPINKEAGS